MTPAFFRFESDFVASLRCIPMGVRFKLDKTGIKLKLSEWSRLEPAQRHALSRQPCDAPEEITLFRLSLLAMVAAGQGAEPALLPQLPEPIWENGGEVPAQVTEKASNLGISITSSGWKELTPLQRFALLKLSRPGHEGKNFRPALEEFGLVSSE